MLGSFRRFLPGGRTQVRDQARRAVDVGAALASPVVPTVLLVAGAGVAFWYWRQWSRGRAEAGEGGLDPLGGEAQAALEEGLSVQGSAEPPGRGR
jgi:hypothetical protein